MPTTDLRAELRARIGDVIASFDRHEVGYPDPDTLQCACGWLGPATEWPTHLADSMAVEVWGPELSAPMLLDVGIA